MPFHPERKGLKALDQQERIEWAYGRTKVSQGFHSGFYNECYISIWRRGIKDLCEDCAMISFSRLCKYREISVSPFEISSVNYYTSDAGAMSSNPLCC